MAAGRKLDWVSGASAAIGTLAGLYLQTVLYPDWQWPKNLLAGIPIAMIVAFLSYHTINIVKIIITKKSKSE